MTDAKLTARSLRDQLAYLMERTLGRLPEKQRDLILDHMEVAVVAYARRAQLDMQERCAEATYLDPNFDGSWHRASGHIEAAIRALAPRDVTP